jgi:hypothetical protein
MVRCALPILKRPAGLALVVCWLAARSASAQESPAGTPGELSPPSPAPVVAPPPPPAPPSIAAPAPEPAPIETTTLHSAPPTGSAEPADDHLKFVRHLAIGYQGVSALPIAASGGPTSLPQIGTVNAPVIGIRYWFRDAVGLDLGFGLAAQTGSEQPVSYGFAFHAGLPLALAHAAHYVFEVVPEATIGFTTGTITSTSGLGDATVGGFLLKAGARAGAEVHFGFIGIPQLALQASIGLYVRRETVSWSQGGVSTSGTSTLLTTSVNDAPWGIFTDTLSALYYF